jgi:spermidine/putrescine transport system ATP-binding protein
MTADVPPLLVLKSLKKSFEGNPVLNGVSIDVRPGEFLTLLGPSGCGKTTTLRIVAGFESPDAGEVVLDGKPMLGVPAYQRDVCTVFQHYALFPHYDVFENVAYGLRIQKVQEPELTQRVREALALVQLDGMERRRIDQLSGGQQQRIALARALVGRPRILLLDEPLGALDLKLRKKMQLELKAIQRKLGLTFIYVTHDQEEALTMSDRIAVFNKGTLEQLGTPKEIYDHPSTAFVADFIGAANLFEGTLVSAEGGSAELMLEGELRLKVPLPEGLLPAKGESLRVAIRPERVKVVVREGGAEQLAMFEGGPGAIVRVPCELKESVFLGSQHQIFLSPFKSSEKLLVAVHGAGQGNGFKAGQKVYADLKFEDLLLLR